MMESLELKTHVGQDGILKIFMPNEMAGKEIRMIMVFETLQHDLERQSDDKANWPEGFFDQIAGSMPDFPEIEYEGNFEKRENFD